VKVPNLAIFGDGCLGIVAQIPLCISVLLLVCRYALRPLWNRRPQWLHEFVPEKVEALETNGDLLITKTTTVWDTTTIALLCISVAGFLDSLLVSLAFNFGPLFLIPAAPCVSSVYMLLRVFSKIS
jgi:hypothetical protein